MEVLCRAAREGDTADVLELTSTIWEGGDYVPHVWSDWLADPRGLLAVAEAQGRVIGLSKLSQIGEDEWWLQGLRVHPEHQGKGVAARLHDYLLEYWQRLGNGVMRLATSSQRVQVHHLCARSGFRKVGEYIAHSAPSLAEPVENFSPLEASESGAALGFGRASELHDLCYGLMDLGWEWCTPNQARLAAASDERRAWWWQDQGAGARLLIVSGYDDEDEENFPTLQLVAGEVEGLTACLVDYRCLAARQGYQRAGWVAPVQPLILDALHRAGFIRDWDNSLYVFEKAHDADFQGETSPHSPRMV